jgi:choloylglycine hydrolase
MNRNVLVFCIAFSMLLMAAHTALYPCSTVMVKQKNRVIVGHNLDMPGHIPGMIVTNNRNIRKSAFSWWELTSGKNAGTPAISWTSKYGSVTFNPLGKEFPDGGVNEAGLYIQEMSMPGTVFPTGKNHPTMFMMQWMQYQLDNYSSVKQVLKNISAIYPDGWAWHFFIADKTGDSAVIEFIDGKIKAYTKGSMPFDVLCNAPYAAELKRLKNYKPFGGNKPVDIKTKGSPRFVHAAAMIKNYDAAKNPVEHTFAILEGLDRGATQWSYAIDITNTKIYFFTAKSKEIKSFNYSAFDFSCKTPARLLDIHSQYKGEVKEKFQTYTQNLNRSFLEIGVSTINGDGSLTRMVESRGNTLDAFITKMANAPKKFSCLK